MIYKAFQDKQLSLLGFGAMRLPEKNGAIDEAAVEEMVAFLAQMIANVEFED